MSNSNIASEDFSGGSNNAPSSQTNRAMKGSDSLPYSSVASNERDISEAMLSTQTNTASVSVASEDTEGTYRTTNNPLPPPHFLPPHPSFHYPPPSSPLLWNGVYGMHGVHQSSGQQPFFDHGSNVIPYMHQGGFLLPPFDTNHPYNENHFYLQQQQYAQPLLHQHHPGIPGGASVAGQSGFWTAAASEAGDTSGYFTPEPSTRNLQAESGMHPVTGAIQEFDDTEPNDFHSLIMKNEEEEKDNEGTSSTIKVPKASEGDDAVQGYGAADGLPSVVEEDEKEPEIDLPHSDSIALVASPTDVIVPIEEQEPNRQQEAQPSAPPHYNYRQIIVDLDEDRTVAEVGTVASKSYITEALLNPNRYRRVNIVPQGADQSAAKASQTRFLTNSEFFLLYGTSINDALNNVRPTRNAAEMISSKGEVDSCAGQMWRSVLKWLIYVTSDKVNCMRLARGGGSLELQLDFLQSHEAYLLAQVIEALDYCSGNCTFEGKRRLLRALNKAFQNRNVTRIMVQNMPRVDLIFHSSTQVSWTRLYDALGQLPFGFGSVTEFPATENFPSTKGHALTSILRVLLGPGHFVTRVVTGGRQGFVVDEERTAAQNLAAEGNGLETAYRNQFGTHYGRQYTNAFRLEHRLPVDESVVRTFLTSPAATMINNGVVHVLRQLAIHWSRMVSEGFGNFSHQRMEQLNVCETLRFHMPIVLGTLANLRGRNTWDSSTLGPFLKELQALSLTSNVHLFDMSPAQDLIERLSSDIMLNVCGGVASRIMPFQEWLNAMWKACRLIEQEATEVKTLVDPIVQGINAGMTVIKRANLTIGSLSSADAKFALKRHIQLGPIKKQLQKFVYVKDSSYPSGERSVPVERLYDESTGAVTDKEACLEKIKNIPTEQKIKLLKVLDPKIWSQKTRDDLERKRGSDGKQANEALLGFVEEDLAFKHSKGTQDAIYTRALELVAPRDKRTLVELIREGFEDTKAAKLLLNRARTLLFREMRRNAFDQYLLNASRATKTLQGPTQLQLHDRYLIETAANASIKIGDRTVGPNQCLGAVWTYLGKKRLQNSHHTSNEQIVQSQSDNVRYLFRDGTGFVQSFNLESSIPKVLVKKYIPVADAIVRAQKAFMDIELDHGGRFSYGAFMEFESLRSILRRLNIVAQMHCSELDAARLNMLQIIKEMSSETYISSNELVPGNIYYEFDAVQKKYFPFTMRDTFPQGELKRLARRKIVRAPPQNMLVVGGGPTGLLTALHCLENCLRHDGSLTLYEDRDAFDKAGGTHERAQIVRLDSRWIAMMRYHLGTGYEDVFVPASGETDAQLGNTLPTQGFVEITIKDLENMLHVQICKLWSRDLVAVHTKSSASYDAATNTLTKKGNSLKTHDFILRNVDHNGRQNDDSDPTTWEVADISPLRGLSASNLQLNVNYLVNVRPEGLKRCQLVSMDLLGRTAGFRFLVEAQVQAPPIFIVSLDNLPLIVNIPSNDNDKVNLTVGILLRCTKKGDDKIYAEELLDYSTVEHDTFTMDISSTHVVFATGKPSTAPEHFKVTTEEPYGVVCIQGLKVSMGMHNFGETRWGRGLWDDIRSQTDQNTRIVGDFTKSVKSDLIVKRMVHLIDTPIWQSHFDMLGLNNGANSQSTRISMQILESLKAAASNVSKWRRKRLQTRFFETGDNYYLGMEFPREYDQWKNTLSALLGFTERTKGILCHHIDRMWYEACISVIHDGDVYNPSGQKFMPDIYLIDSPIDVELSSLDVGDSFHLLSTGAKTAGDAAGRLAFLCKHPSDNFLILARNVEGKIVQLERNNRVYRESDLTRGPDGEKESKVAIATFPVAHYVNFRAMRLNERNLGYCIFFAGDLQSTPHFMRYSGLTGAGINSMLINRFVGQVVTKPNTRERLKALCAETNWSNSEVVTRGTGSNYGEDGFLRPGFSYGSLIKFMFAKLQERADLDPDVMQKTWGKDLFSTDWQKKIAASLIPRRMELNAAFKYAVELQLFRAIFELLKEKLGNDTMINQRLRRMIARRCDATIARAMEGNHESSSRFMGWVSGDLGMLLANSERFVLDDDIRAELFSKYMYICVRICDELQRVHDLAKDECFEGKRISSQMENEPKSVDTIVDDFAVEAQNFANSLALSSLLTAAAIAFQSKVLWLGALISAFNIFVSFGTITESSRYRIRNEELRAEVIGQRYNSILKLVFRQLTPAQQGDLTPENNPYLQDAENKMKAFLRNLEYYVPSPMTSPSANSRVGDTTVHPDAQDLVTNFRSALSCKDNLDVLDQFIAALESQCIPVAFYKNSYLQADLVSLLEACQAYLLVRQSAETYSDTTSVQDTGAIRLFRRLLELKPQLERSVQREGVRWGFLKRRKISHWAIFAPLDHIFFILTVGCAPSARSFSSRCLPLPTEIKGVIKQMEEVQGNINERSNADTAEPNSLGDGRYLARAIRDLQELYFATNESNIAAMITLVGVGTFFFSIILTIINAAQINTKPTSIVIASLSGVLSIAAALLAANHFARKCFHQFSLTARLFSTTSTMEDGGQESLSILRRLSFLQGLVSLFKIFAGLLSLLSVISTFAVNISRDPNLAISGVDVIVFAIIFAFCAIGLWLILFAVVKLIDYFFLHNLSPTFGDLFLGREPFRTEALNISGTMSYPRFGAHDPHTLQVLDSPLLRDEWSYTARTLVHSFRFDTILEADRFCTILQHIQSGSPLEGIHPPMPVWEESNV